MTEKKKEAGVDPGKIVLDENGSFELSEDDLEKIGGGMGKQVIIVIRGTKCGPDSGGGTVIRGTTCTKS